MRLSTFQKKMTKPAFTWPEARVIAHGDSPQALRLSLHRWVKRGELLRIRRGVFAFPGKTFSMPVMASALYPPAYISLESALSEHGLIPDVPFEATLVTTRATRIFKTTWGSFHFHHIQPRLFFGYDPKTLLAEPEKALLDYLYFRRPRLKADPAFWRQVRFQHLRSLDWARGKTYLSAYHDIKVDELWRSLKTYAKTHFPA